MLEVHTERVLVIPTSTFRDVGYFQGFSREVDRYLGRLLDREAISFRPRDEMEEDPSFKQLIPYVIVRHAPPGRTPQIFQYTRGKGQGEGRLHSKRSVGIGGHISAADEREDSSVHPYQEGLQRELAEEITIDSPYTERIVGLINDDLTAVGKVHLGVVHLLDVEQPRVEPREADIIEAGFRPITEILGDMSAFETWSQICLQALFGPGAK